MVNIPPPNNNEEPNPGRIYNGEQPRIEINVPRENLQGTPARLIIDATIRDGRGNGIPGATINLGGVNFAPVDMTPRNGVLTRIVTDLAVIKTGVERTYEQVQFIRQASESVLRDIGVSQDPAQTIFSSFDALPDAIGRSVCNEIVGESYFRWDSTSKFYPTLIFHFKEAERTAYPKRTQIKIRLTSINEGDTITDDQIEQWRVLCEDQIPGVQYFSGPIRCNYVSSTGCSWKTTVFCNDEDEAHEILKAIIEPFGERYEPREIQS